MQKKYIGLGLMLALWIAGAAWSRQPATGTLVSSHVVSVDASLRERGSDGPVSGTANVEAACGSGRHRVGETNSRRLLGLWGLATVGVLLVLRSRRPLTI